MNRRHWRRALLAGALSLSLLMGTAWAAGEYPRSKPLKLIEEYDITLVRTGVGEGGDAPASYPAAVLYSYGLLEGTGTEGNQITLDVDKSLTRHEGVTMLVRLMGKEAQARAGSWDMPFTDVADWAAPYVGYAYAQGIANGTSATTFSGTARMSREQFLTMVLRALGWSDQAGDFSWSAPDSLAGEEGLLCPLLSETGFYRGDAIFISYEALDAQVKGSGITLLERLDQQGALQNRGVANPSGGVVLTARADTLEVQLDYLRGVFGTGAEVDLSGYPTLTEGLKQVLAYCEERNLVPGMPAHMLSEAEEVGALSRTERDALEEEMMGALQNYLDFLPAQRVEASGYSPYDYDRDFYLAQAEYLADRLPRAGWKVRVPDTPMDRDSLYHEGYVARFYAEKGIIPGYLSSFDIEQNWNGWLELSGEGREGTCLLKSMEALCQIYYELVDEDMSDYEKVKAIYEGVMARTEYNYDFYEAGLAGETRAGSERVLAGTWIGLVEGSDMVCAGYADSVAVLLDMAGIPNVQVSGDPGDGSPGHAWNRVLLDGVWYNLDATWGDSGRNHSAYFLRSDAAFQRDGHQPYGFGSDSPYVYDYPAPRDYR